MLGKRLLSIAVLAPITIAALIAGGWWLALFIAVLIAFAAWEYGHMFNNGGYDTFIPGIILGSILFVVLRQGYGFEYADLLIAFLILVLMAWHTLQYQRGHATSALDFCISLSGVLYLGWTIAYFISIRNLPDGVWWVFLVVLGIAFADAGAYFVGRGVGKHKMMDKVSPKKSWEGYLGGIVITTILNSVVAAIFHNYAPSITTLHGILLGLILGTLAPLGDFGESMLKRAFGVKDSSNLIPGHGGFLDRLDSFFWAGIIGYYLITLLFKYI
jgi:phosphatidate cytidylyltransferase